MPWHETFAPQGFGAIGNAFPNCPHFLDALRPAPEVIAAQWFAALFQPDSA